MGNKSLIFDNSKYTCGTVQVGDKTVNYKFYENVPYVAKPNAPHLQVMNLYVPELENVDSAPIFFLQRTGGMGETLPMTIETDNTDSIPYALSQGYVVVSPGARGRETVVDGIYVGRGELPMSIVDLKAAVRYLRHNKGLVPGDVEKIVESGLSSGGGMSALLGVSGNSHNYDKYLREIGAADERDDIFLCSVSCPITDFEHIDIAYEWMFGPEKVEGLFADNADFMAMSGIMAKRFEEYVNSLALHDPDTGAAISFDGEDTYTPYLYQKLCESATQYLSGLSEEERKAWLADEHNSKVLDWDGEKAVIRGMKEYAAWNTGRWMRYVGCYDGFDEKPSRENEAFGSVDGKKAGHFSRSVGEVVASFEQYSEIGSAWIADAKLHERGEYLINPMNYIGTGEACTTAPYWYMRCGGHHETTGNVFLNLVLRLIDYTDSVVDWRFSWMQRHSPIAEIEKEEAFAFYNKCCKQKES